MSPTSLNNFDINFDIQANAQEKFMRIKHAYNTLLNSESKRKFDSGNRASDFSYSTTGRNQSRKPQDDEEFYGFGNKLRYRPILLFLYSISAMYVTVNDKEI